jgi:hypothetical protein
MHFIRVIRNSKPRGLHLAVYRGTGINFGLLGTRDRVFRNYIRVIRNSSLGYQEPKYRVIRNQAIGLLGTAPYHKSLNPLQNHPHLPNLTRARDLNSITNTLTPNPLPNTPAQKGAPPPWRLSTHPTRLTPARNTLRAIKIIPENTAAPPCEPADFRVT